MTGSKPKPSCKLLSLLNSLASLGGARQQSEDIYRIGTRLFRTKFPTPISHITVFRLVHSLGIRVERSIRSGTSRVSPTTTHEFAIAAV